MSPIDTINRVINMISLAILLLYIVKTYRQVRSLNFLDYFVLYLKHRKTIYAEMQRNPQMRQKQLLSLFVSLMILTFWVIGSLEKLMTAWNFGNLINALIVLWLFGYFLYQTWQNKYLNEQNRYLTFANHFQRKHFNAVMAIFKRKLTARSAENDEDMQARERFQRLFDQVSEQARRHRKAAMLSDDMYALFDDQLLLRADSKPLTGREKKLLSYYVGYWDAEPYNDYNLSMIEEMDDQERRIVTKVLNITMAMMGFGLVLLAIRQILG
ncbi:hypothetical protein [Lacticaseibacillus paracasei]|uniref:hypothetical protein n=1 Tax=Lacticaseibacillus paracasei TaxID=1597 RepID=UPI001C490D83|nr:hypothetical protein [Lacticaseibacillus paracasei]QXJ67296.1 hypothetical protein J5Y16_10265 [Lacticaseibacillus paracasei subsp. paracasei]